MKIVDLILKSGFASSKKEAQRFVKQAGVRLGWLATFEPVTKKTEEWEKDYIGKEYIEVLDPITDINHDVSEPEEAHGWYLFVGKRNIVHIPAIFIDTKDRAEKFKLVMRIKETREGSKTILSHDIKTESVVDLDNSYRICSSEEALDAYVIEADKLEETRKYLAEN